MLLRPNKRFIPKISNSPELHTFKGREGGGEVGGHGKHHVVLVKVEGCVEKFKND